MDDIIIEIPNYIRQIKLSNKIREIYYIWDGQSIHAKRKNVPNKYLKVKDIISVQPQHLANDYCIIEFKNKKPQRIIRENILHCDFKKFKYILCEKINNLWTPVLANPIRAGKENMQTIRGQDIYSGMNEMIRAKIMREIKESFKPYIKNFPVIKEYPLKISLFIYDTVVNQLSNNKEYQEWDIGNRAFPYGKAFLDLLVSEKLLVNDDILHITQDCGGIFVPIDKDENRKLVFLLQYDYREELLTNKYYNGTLVKDDEFPDIKYKKPSEKRLQTIRKLKFGKNDNRTTD